MVQCSKFLLRIWKIQISSLSTEPVFRGFSQTFEENNGVVPFIRRLFSKFFQFIIHLSSINSTQCNQSCWKASLNKPQTNTNTNIKTGRRLTNVYYVFFLPRLPILQINVDVTKFFADYPSFNVI